MNGQLQFLYTQPTTDADILGVFENNQVWLTRLDIARRVMRKKTPAMIERIERLVSEGHLERMVSKLPNGVDMFVYRVIVNPYEIPF